MNVKASFRRAIDTKYSLLGILHTPTSQDNVWQ